MKLKKKTRKQLRRLARSAGALGEAFATELLVQLTASFAAERVEREEATRRGRARGPSNGTPERAGLPRTADSN